MSAPSWNTTCQGCGRLEGSMHEQDCTVLRELEENFKKAKVAETKRQPVDYRYDALNWDFIHMMAEVAHLGGQKYGTPEQYISARLIGEKSPMNHILNHYREYMKGELHDHFHDLEHHLAVIAYNAMMEFYYHKQFGWLGSPLLKHQDAK
jgi:hypothetical protein